MQLKLLRFYYGFLSALFPAVAARKAFNLFQHVRIKTIRNREREFYNTVQKTIVPFDLEPASRGEPLSCYSMGDPNGKTVILVHGWDSNAGSMSQIAKSLALAGFNVYLFDLPGHAVYKKSFTNLPECSAAFKEIINHIAPKEPVSIVGHSFGSAVTAWFLAESGYKADKLIFLTGPNRVQNVFEQFKKVINLGDRAYVKMVQITEDILGKSLDEVSIASHFQKSNYSKLILIHDKFDKVLPYKHSLEITEAIPTAELITVENTGHYRIMWNDEVIKMIVVKLGIPKD